MPRHLNTVVETVEAVETLETPYCTSLVCTCGNDCHLNVVYHRTVTSPLEQEVDDEEYEFALVLLGGKP